MSSEDESDEMEDQGKTDEKEDFPSSRQAKKVARLNEILYQNEHKAKISKVSKILKKKEHERTEEEKEILGQSPEITERLSKLKERRGTLKQRQLEIEDPREDLEMKCKELAAAIRHSKKVVVYTGAGISTAASIPDYRGPNGVWTLLQKGQQPKPQDLCDAKPTLTHMSIKKLQDEGHVSHVVSQNCDGLHMRSGLNRRKLSEVHGNMYIEICYNCKPHQEYIRLFDVTEKTGVRRHQTDRNCHTCKEPLKDTIVHFGEKGGMKCPYRWKEAAKAADRCEIILCLGSSLKILKKYSCLWCMDRKVKDRPKLYIVNLQWTPRDDAATMKINGRCDEVMQLVMKDLQYEIPKYNEDEDPLFTFTTPLLDNELETTTKKILTKSAVKSESRRSSTDINAYNSIKPEQHVVKTENNVVIKTENGQFENNQNTNFTKVSNHSTFDNQNIKMDNSQLLARNSQLMTDSIRQFNSTWSTSSIFPYHPFITPPFIQGMQNLRHQAKFGEVSFQKYVTKVDNEKKEIVKSSVATFGDVTCSVNMKSYHHQNLSEHHRTSDSNSNKKEKAVFDNKQPSVVVKNGKLKPDCNGDKPCEHDESKKDIVNNGRTYSGRRNRKSFCPNCHGVMGNCPCTVIDSVKKKKPTTTTLCPLCRQSTDSCDCHPNSVSHSFKCHSCQLSSSMCKCHSRSKRQSLCHYCRHPPDQCNCVQNGQRNIQTCSLCHQNKSMCKCVPNHTSSSNQGTNVPNFTSITSLPRPLCMPLLDYANIAFPMNNFLPFYMPPVFHNDQINSLLHSNNMNGLLPVNKLNGHIHGSHTNGLLPVSNVNGLSPSISKKDFFQVDPVFQDHSYLNKDQMQSLSPNCDKTIRRTQPEDIKLLKKDQVDCIKPNLKRSYSYVDDIQRSEDDIESIEKSPEKSVQDHSKSKLGEVVSSKQLEPSSSPIIIDDDDEKKEENQEKPKLMRSISVPGWFGKGLNLRKKRR